MKFKTAFIILIVSVFFITSASWATAPVEEQSQSLVSSSTIATLEPLVKGSSGGSRSSSSSSSKSKVKSDSDDELTGDNSTNSTDNGSGSSWWTIILVLIFVGVIAVVAIWFLFLRK